jgi:multisubunit Na+/H+ antiporter MnhB subunit
VTELRADVSAEEPSVDPLPDADAYVEPVARRYPSTIGGFCYLLVLAATGVGVGVVWAGDWRDGVKWIGGAMIAAAAIRLVLPTRSAGMLAVRKRGVDAFLLAAVGVGVIFLSESIPNQPL